MQWLRILAENRLARGVGDAHDADGPGIGESAPVRETLQMVGRTLT